MSEHAAEIARLKAEVVKDRGRLDRLAKGPIGGWEFHTIVFTAGATNTTVPHELRLDNPDDVRWIVVSVNAEAIISRDPGTPWPSGQIILQSSVPATARLLLFVEA